VCFNEYNYLAHDSQDGKYSCKSRYMFLMEETDGNMFIETPNPNKEIWKGIWSLSVPN